MNVNVNVNVVFVAGVCTNGTAPSVSSINRILRNRAAERAAAEFARAAGYGLYAHAQVRVELRSDLVVIVSGRE